MTKAMPIDGAWSGYIRLHRKLLANPLFRDKPAAWFKIWIFILLKANWRESTFRPRQGEQIVVPAGSLITSLEKLGTHAALSKEHARRCLDYLERTHSITLRRTHHWTMITIVNWAAYQQVDDEAQHAGHHTEHHSEVETPTHHPPQPTPHAATPSKEVKNLTKKYTSNSDELDTPSGWQSDRPKMPRRTPEIDPVIREWFEQEFWPVYPRHEGKQSAMAAAAGKATTSEKRAFYLARLQQQLPAYLERKNASGQRVIPMGATWFNQDRADDELQRAPEPAKRASSPDDYPDYIPLSAAGGASR